MKITFFGAAETVTGSCYMIDTGTSKFLVDCGLFQGSKTIKERNYGDFPFNPAEIDFLILTHAHIDHAGLVPKLYKHGFAGPVFTTTATAELCTAVLPDSGYIQEMEVERKNRKNRRSGSPLLEPIYTAQDAQDCLKHFQGVHYDEFWEVYPNITVRFRDAGHILGSSIVEIWIDCPDGRTCKIVFSGDLGAQDRPLANDPSIIDHAHYLIVESTYGDRLHKAPGNRREALAQVIQDTFRRGGNVIIPAFAIERTQDLLYNLHLLIQEGKIAGENIYIDSPLAIRATEIFCRHQHLLDEDYKELRKSSQSSCPLLLPGLQFSRTPEESMALNKINGGAIIISASGMADAGRIKHHLKHNLWKPESTVVFIGYQAAGTLGRRLIEGEKRVRIHGEEIQVRAQIVNLEGFSAHADQAEILDWVSHFKNPPKKIFVTHGEPKSSLALAQRLQEQLNIDAVVPKYLEEHELLSHLKTEIDVQSTITKEKLYAIAQRITDTMNRLIETETDQQKGYDIYNLLTSMENLLKES